MSYLCTNMKQILKLSHAPLHRPKMNLNLNCKHSIKSFKLPYRVLPHTNPYSLFIQMTATEYASITQFRNRFHVALNVSVSAKINK